MSLGAAAQLLADAQAFHRDLVLPPVATHRVPVLFSGQNEQLHVLKPGQFGLKLVLDGSCPSADWRGAAVVRSGPHVIGLDDGVRVQQVVLGGQNVPAVSQVSSA